MTKIERNGNCVKVTLRGELDHCSAIDMRAVIETAIKDMQVMEMHLDFTQVSFMDSSGVGMLIGRYKTMHARGGKISARGLNAQTEKLYRMAGLHRIIPIENSSEGEERHE